MSSVYNLVQNLFSAIQTEKTISPSSFDNLNFEAKKINNEILLLISVCYEITGFCVCQGRGDTFKMAIHSALNTYYQNTNHKRLKPKSLRLDIITEIHPAKNANPLMDIQRDEILYKQGLDGLALGNNFEVLFLPEEVMIHQIIQNHKLQVAGVKNALKKHYLPSINEDLIPSISNALELEVYNIRTASYYIDENGPFSLFNGHRLFRSISKEDIMDAILLTKDHYFKHVVNKKGKFSYSYLPQENQNEKSYNILRHAGTTYSILETYELIPDKKLLKIAESAMDFLLDKVRNFKIKGSSVSAVIEKDILKLGGNALAIIALAKYTQITKNQKHLPLMQRMATWIRETQDEEGRFTVHKKQFSTGEMFDLISHYYPGEAMLSLIRLYQIDGNAAWLDTVERSAHYLIHIRDKDANIDTIAHDHWLLYALNELYRERPKALYLNHALFISQAIIKSQNTDHDEISHGAYGQPQPRLESTPTACRSEGLCATYHLTKDFGLETEYTKIKTTIQNGIRFQLQTQLRAESVMYYENKNLCLGAFQRGLTQYDLRIDFTQHNISSLIAYYRILSEQNQP